MSSKISNHINFSIEVTFPLDITKTRLQIQGERASTVPSTTTANVPYRGMVRTAVGIGEDSSTFLQCTWFMTVLCHSRCHSNIVLLTVEEEGLRNLWSGVTPAVLRHVGKFIFFLNNIKWT